MSRAAASLEVLRATAAAVPPAAPRRERREIPGLPCRCAGCLDRDVAGEEQTQIVAPAHELHVADGQRLIVRWRQRHRRREPGVRARRVRRRALVRRLGRLRLRLEHDRAASL